MTKWSEEAKEKQEEIRLCKIEECADALIDVLEKLGADKRGKAVLWKTVIPLIPDQIEENRRKEGFVDVPCIMNKEVKVAAESFMRNRRNRKEVKMYCESYGYYIVWSMSGEPQGIRLGTLEEYIGQQSQISNVTMKYAEWHNDRAEIIRSKGRNAGVLDLKLKQRRKDRK
jgi:hypothetical protein